MTEQTIDPADPAIGWLAEPHQDSRAPQHPWRPCLDIAGRRYHFDVWFTTREDCEEWINRWVVGRGQVRVSP